MIPLASPGVALELRVVATIGMHVAFEGARLGHQTHETAKVFVARAEVELVLREIWL